MLKQNKQFKTLPPSAYWSMKGIVDGAEAEAGMRLGLAQLAKIKARQPLSSCSVSKSMTTSPLIRTWAQLRMDGSPEAQRNPEQPARPSVYLTPARSGKPGKFTPHSAMVPCSSSSTVKQGQDRSQGRPRPVIYVNLSPTLVQALAEACGLSRWQSMASQ